MRRRVFPLLLLPLILSGCTVFGQSPDAAYVAGDRATYNAIAPEYIGYVNADARLTPVQKARRKHTEETWRLRVTNALRDNSTATVLPTTAPAVQPSP